MKNYCKLNKLFHFLLLFFLTPFVAKADPIMFHGAIQAKDGNLWFATIGAGVYRYDGISGKFTNFTMKDGLLSNNVSSLIEDRAGNLWIGTESGVNRYDGKTFTDVTMKNGLCGSFVNCVFEDRTGNLWFGTNGYGVCRYDPRSNEYTHFTKDDGLGSDAVQCIYEDKAGKLWFGERAGGVSIYDLASNRFTKFEGGACLGTQVMSIIEDKTGNIWFANLYEGLCKYNPVTSEFTHITEENGLCSNIVTGIYEDKKGNLWIGSDSANRDKNGGGLCRYDGNSYKQFTTTDGITQMNVWCVLEDKDGVIWVCTKGGLYRYHSPSGKFIDYTYKINSSKY